VSSDEATIYVANLPWDTAEGDLGRLFGQFATVVDVRVIQDPQTGRSRGYGFVELADAGQAAAVCAALNECRFNGRRLQVRSARPKPARQQQLRP
jgi:RNA recognition motif-containing protein